MEIKEKTMEDQKVAIMNYKGALKDMDVLTYLQYSTITQEPQRKMKLYTM